MNGENYKHDRLHSMCNNGQPLMPPSLSHDLHMANFKMLDDARNNMANLSLPLLKNEPLQAHYRCASTFDHHHLHHTVPPVWRQRERHNDVTTNISNGF